MGSFMSWIVYLQPLTLLSPAFIRSGSYSLKAVCCWANSCCSNYGLYDTLFNLISKIIHSTGLRTR